MRDRGHRSAIAALRQPELAAELALRRRELILRRQDRIGADAKTVEILLDGLDGIGELVGRLRDHAAEIRKQRDEIGELVTDQPGILDDLLRLGVKHGGDLRQQRRIVAERGGVAQILRMLFCQCGGVVQIGGTRRAVEPRRERILKGLFEVGDGLGDAGVDRGSSLA